MSTPTASRHAGWLFRSLSVLATSLMLTSCVSEGGDDSNGESSEEKSEGGDNSASEGALATSITTATSLKSNLEVSLQSLERAGNGIVLLEISATNNGDSSIQPVRLFSKPARMGGVASTADGVTLVDTVNNERYYALQRSGEDECLCSKSEDIRQLEPDSTIEFWVAFPEPPDGVDAMSVTTPVTADFIDIPVSEADDPDTDITETPVNDPVIMKITSYQDDLSGDSSRENTGNETSIMLSSDVLFDTDESELTSDADDALEQIAQEIDDSSDEEIQIDGYTDNTGNDSINNPLSKDRAKAVEEQLADLVTRDGVNYEVAGHGSSDPVADNDSEDGRQKNRRVTITFEK